MRTLEEKFERSAKAAARSNAPSRVRVMRDRLVATLKHRESQLAGRQPKPNRNMLQKEIRLRVFNEALAEGWAGANLRSNRHKRGEYPLSRRSRKHGQTYIQ